MTKTFKPVLKLLENKKNDLIQYEAEYKKLKKEISALEKRGIVNAKPSYKMKKYFYLIHPMKNGKRKQEYVGSDETKIKQAKQKIENYENWVIKKERQKSILNEVSDFEMRLWG